MRRVYMYSIMNVFSNILHQHFNLKRALSYLSLKTVIALICFDTCSSNQHAKFNHYYLIFCKVWKFSRWSKITIFFKFALQFRKKHGRIRAGFWWVRIASWNKISSNFDKIRRWRWTLKIHFDKTWLTYLFLATLRTVNFHIVYEVVHKWYLSN